MRLNELRERVLVRVRLLLCGADVAQQLRSVLLCLRHRSHRLMQVCLELCALVGGSVSHSGGVRGAVLVQLLQSRVHVLMHRVQIYMRVSKYYNTRAKAH